MLLTLPDEEFLCPGQESHMQSQKGAASYTQNVPQNSIAI